MSSLAAADARGGVGLAELGDRGGDERHLVLEVTARDQLALGVRRQPAVAAREQLLDLVVADPIVLVVVEHWQQHVQVGEQLREAHLAAQTERQVAAVAPVRVAWVEGDRGHLHLVAERLEQAAHERLSATRRHHGQLSRERERLGREVRASVAAAVEGGLVDGPRSRRPGTRRRRTGGR
ncbi:MAG: hypothetical protein PGN13_07270 [Patulibacter minatonensis]